ncbi:MAG: carbohydrate ABC transporter permease [Oscillospiraceae bacterium]
MKREGSKVLYGLLLVALTVMALATLYPFIYVISMSISSADAVLNREVLLFPVGFSLESYKMVFENPDIWRAYGNTIFYTAAGTAINLLLTLTCAYSASRKDFVLRKPLMVFITITMVFNGGMIPTFVLITRLKLYNTIWAILLPGAVSAWNLIIARNFFSTTIPQSVIESARIDGAGELTVFLKIVLPLSRAIIAVLGLFYAVGHWNMWFKAMLYVPDQTLHPLQLFLRRILLLDSPEMLAGVDDAFQRVAYAMQLKYAVIVVATLPILCVYPFLIKYFNKGIMLGAIKE